MVDLLLGLVQLLVDFLYAFDYEFFNLDQMAALVLDFGFFALNALLLLSELLFDLIGFIDLL